MVKSTLLHNVTLKQLQKLQNATKVLDSICNPALSLVAVMGSPMLTDPSRHRPDLAKFCHFGKICKTLAIFDSLNLIWQNVEPTLANFLHY